MYDGVLALAGQSACHTNLLLVHSSRCGMLSYTSFFVRRTSLRCMAFEIGYRAVILEAIC